jgi:plasmid maintenance system antidote protein VapI
MTTEENHGLEYLACKLLEFSRQRKKEERKQLIPRTGAAAALGIPSHRFDGLIQRGVLPAPTHRLVAALRYTPEEVEQLKVRYAQWLKEEKQRTKEKKLEREKQRGQYKKLYGMERAAKAMGISTQHLRTLIARGILPGPTHLGPHANSSYQAANPHRYYTQEELEQLKQKYDAIDLPRAVPVDYHKQRADQGLYNKKAAARYLGVFPLTFTNWIDAGWLPQPTHRIGFFKYYKREELDSFKPRIARSLNGNHTLLDK